MAGQARPAGFAISMFMGLSLPWLASSFRPFLPYSIFLFVTLTFARADFAGVRRVLQQPGKLAVAVAWITLCMPVLIGLALAIIGRDSIEPGLLLGIALIAAAPPLMGVPAYAALLGLDNSLCIAFLVISLVLTPFVSPSLASFVAGDAVPIDPSCWAFACLRCWAALASPASSCARSPAPPASPRAGMSSTGCSCSSTSSSP